MKTTIRLAIIVAVLAASWGARAQFQTLLGVGHPVTGGSPPPLTSTTVACLPPDVMPCADQSSFTIPGVF